MRVSTFTRDMLVLFAGPIVWAVHFLGAYVLTAIVCARPGAQPAWTGTPLLATTLVVFSLLSAVVIAAVVQWVPPRPRDADTVPFVRWVARGLGWLSILAIAWETVGVFTLPVCTSVA